MNKETVYKTSSLTRNVVVILLSVVSFILAIYFKNTPLLGLAFSGFLGVLGLFLNNLEEQVVTLTINEHEKIKVSTVQYLIIKRYYILNIGEIKFNSHHHKKSKEKGLELFLILNTGRVLKLNTKFWNKEKLASLSTKVFKTDALV